MPLRITTWNVNGIRNPFGYQPWRETRTFDNMFDILESDIVIMQELKIQRKDLRDDMVLIPGWDCYFSLPKHKKGYSGVGIYTRQSVCAAIRAEEGLLGVLCPPGSTIPYNELPHDQSIGGYPTLEQITDLGLDPLSLDAEGRCVVLEFPAFVLFGIYSPANSNGLRDNFRYGFLCALDARVRNLVRMGKRVIVTGDLNVSRAEIDTASAEDSMRKEGITHEEYISTPNRRIFNQLLEGGDVVGVPDAGREEPVLWDVCRGFHEGRSGMYTHWEQKINARPGNFGSRIDYVLCSLDMKHWIYDSNIQEGLMGSDHCPVYAAIKDQIMLEGKEIHAVDVMNPPGVFVNGKRKRAYTSKDILPSSGRLLPEFDKRQTIKAMFARKNTTPIVNPSCTDKELHSQVEKAEEAVSTSGQSPSLSKTIKPGLSKISSPKSKSAISSDHITAKMKRPSGDSPTSQSKRTKGKPSSANTRPSTKGQSTLQGFLKPSSVPTPTVEDPEEWQINGHNGLSISPSENSTSQGGSRERNSESETLKPIDHPSPASPIDNLLGQIEEDRFTTRLVTKESWDKVFAKRTVPRCDGHDEPCISYVSKKKGLNCGRKFWVCQSVQLGGLFDKITRRLFVTGYQTPWPIWKQGERNPMEVFDIHMGK